MAPVQFDKRLKQIVGPEMTVQLSKPEWAIVDRLSRSAGDIIEPDVLASVVWPNGAVGVDELKALRDHIYNIREKIKMAGGKRDMLQTVVGWGYVMFLDEKPVNRPNPEQ